MAILPIFLQIRNLFAAARLSLWSECWQPDSAHTQLRLELQPVTHVSIVVEVLPSPKKIRLGASPHLIEHPEIRVILDCRRFKLELPLYAVVMVWLGRVVFRA